MGKPGCRLKPMTKEKRKEYAARRPEDDEELLLEQNGLIPERWDVLKSTDEILLVKSRRSGQRRILNKSKVEATNEQSTGLV